MKIVKRHRGLILSILVLALFMVPFVVGAQGLVPCDGSEKNPCDYNAFVKGIEVIINWFIVTGVTVSAIGFAYVGFVYITEGANSGKRAAANQTFTKIATGLFFVLGAWLIVKLILTGLGADLTKFPLSF